MVSEQLMGDEYKGLRTYFLPESHFDLVMVRHVAG
jgi:hypothetical protein